LLAFFGILLCAIISLPACITQPPPPPPLPEQPQTQNETPKNPLSHGRVTATVEKGKTTQADLLELFGGPNIATTDADGVEIWVYEVKSSTSSTESQAAVSARVDKFMAFFLIAGMGQATGQAQGQSSSTTTFSTRNVTFIVKFNPDKTVKDYSVRDASF
jgi:hypothetical protein